MPGSGLDVPGRVTEERQIHGVPNFQLSILLLSLCKCIVSRLLKAGTQKGIVEPLDVSHLCQMLSVPGYVVSWAAGS